MVTGSNSTDFQDNYIFLFNDLFLITRQKKKGYDLKGQVPLGDARIVDIADTDGKQLWFFCLLTTFSNRGEECL